MLYRRFGRTELPMPVITCGGMRYQASWNGDELDKITADGQANLAATLLRAVEAGITHIETARGYGTSEHQIGRVMGELSREKLILQTKLPPTETGEEFASWFDESLQRLQVDHVDLLSIHGINNHELLARSIAPGGPVDVADRLRREGRVGHVGFSTHAETQVILDAIATDRFDYVNLHHYWIFRDNAPAVLEARRRDMGVFIISPNDKGGKLYEPSDKLVELCKPLSPMVFNDLWCLLRGEVHTLSIGAARPEDFAPHIEAVEHLGRSDTVRTVAEIDARLNAAAIDALGATWWKTWRVGLPRWQGTPGQVNIPVILMLWNLAKAFDMAEYGKMRYNLLGNGGHWFPGAKLGETDPGDLVESLAGSPHRDQVLTALVEADRMLAGDEVKRLQEDDAGS